MLLAQIHISINIIIMTRFTYVTIPFSISNINYPRKWVYGYCTRQTVTESPEAKPKI